MRNEKSIFNYVIIVGASVSAIIALTIILGATIMAIIYPDADPPKFLEEWGGMIIGFYFGSFISLLKDWSCSQREQTSNSRQAN